MHCEGPRILKDSLPCGDLMYFGSEDEVYALLTPVRAIVRKIQLID